MKASALEIVEAVAVCAWLLFPLFLALLTEYPSRERSARKRRGHVNH